MRTEGRQTGLLKDPNSPADNLIIGRTSPNVDWKGKLERRLWNNSYKKAAEFLKQAQEYEPATKTQFNEDPKILAVARQAAEKWYKQTGMLLDGTRTIAATPEEFNKWWAKVEHNPAQIAQVLDYGGQAFNNPVLGRLATEVVEAAVPGNPLPIWQQNQTRKDLSKLPSASQSGMPYATKDMGADATQDTTYNTVDALGNLLYKVPYIGQAANAAPIGLGVADYFKTTKEFNNERHDLHNMADSAARGLSGGSIAPAYPELDKRPAATNYANEIAGAALQPVNQAITPYWAQAAMSGIVPAARGLMSYSQIKDLTPDQLSRIAVANNLPPDSSAAYIAANTSGINKINPIGADTNPQSIGLAAGNVVGYQAGNKAMQRAAAQQLAAQAGKSAPTIAGKALTTTGNLLRGARAAAAPAAIATNLANTVYDYGRSAVDSRYAERRQDEQQDLTNQTILKSQTGDRSLLGAAARAPINFLFGNQDQLTADIASSWLKPEEREQIAAETNRANINAQGKFAPEQEHQAYNQALAELNSTFLGLPPKQLENAAWRLAQRRLTGTAETGDTDEHLTIFDALGSQLSNLSKGRITDPRANQYMAKNMKRLVRELGPAAFYETFKLSNGQINPVVANGLVQRAAQYQKYGVNDKKWESRHSIMPRIHNEADWVDPVKDEINKYNFNKPPTPVTMQQRALQESEQRRENLRRDAAEMARKSSLVGNANAAGNEAWLDKARATNAASQQKYFNLEKSLGGQTRNSMNSTMANHLARPESNFKLNPAVLTKGFTPEQIEATMANHLGRTSREPYKLPDSSPETRAAIKAVQPGAIDGQLVNPNPVQKLGT